MNKTRILTLICIGILLILMHGAEIGAAAYPGSIAGGGSPADHPWYLQTVEAISGGEVGHYAALAFHPSTAKPYISHYDATNQELHLSYPVDENGNCGTDSAWYCEVVDTAGDVGQYSSIDIYYDHSSGDRKTGIAYYDATNLALKIAIWSCPTMGTCGWRISTVQAGVSGLNIFGRYPSLKFDSLGVAQIAYYYSESFVGDDALMYARYVGSGGNCGVGSAAGKWDCETVMSGPNTGSHTSLALTDNDAPYIAFYDASPGEIHVCNHVGTDWACAVIDSAGYGFPAIALDDNDHAHIAYYDQTRGMLRYAHYIGSGGNCGLNAYRCDDITAIGTGLDPVGISLAIKMNSPIIAYQNASEPVGFPTLDIARPITAYTGQIAGNCGPLVGIIPQWQCDTLDHADQGGGSGYLYEADYVSVGFDVTGLAAVAYYEYDDYHHEGRLKFAYQQREYTIFLPLVFR